MTDEGRRVWALVMRLGGQLRIAPSGRVIGWDMTAALALARALGSESAAAALLPLIEPVMTQACNDQNTGADQT